MVTHDPRFAHHADRLVHLLDGRITSDEMSEPDHSSVARLAGVEHGNRR